MRRVGLVIVAALAIASCGRTETPAAETAAPAPAAAPAAEAPAALEAAWTATDGIQTPESTYYDAASNSIFTSQIVGAPDGADGNGRIVKLDANGKVVNANFATGLNAPKGLRVHNGTLWAADLGEVIGFDVNSGKVTSRVKLDGAMFPNDVAVGGDGTVYVSDMMGNKIFAVKDGKSSVFVEGEQLEHPNGLLVDGDRLVVGGWGSAPKPDFSTDVPGNLFAIDLKTKAKTPITKQPIANIDGVESDGSGGYVVTDYLKGEVIRVSSSGESRAVAKFMPGTADIGVMPMTGHSMLIVPHMNENKVAAYVLP
jgi:sugar lactone lactonase YvrE